MILFVKEDKMEKKQMQIKISEARIVDAQASVQANGYCTLCLKLMGENGSKNYLHMRDLYFSKAWIRGTKFNITPEGECDVLFELEKKEVRIDPDASKYSSLD